MLCQLNCITFITIRLKIIYCDGKQVGTGIEIGNGTGIEIEKLDPASDAETDPEKEISSPIKTRITGSHAPRGNPSGGK
jgi:hypothetical protein